MAHGAGLRTPPTRIPHTNLPHALADAPTHRAGRTSLYSQETAAVTAVTCGYTHCSCDLRPRLEELLPEHDRPPEAFIVVAAAHAEGETVLDGLREARLLAERRLCVDNVEEEGVGWG